MRTYIELWNQKNSELCTEIDGLKDELQCGKTRVKDLWQVSCDQVREADEIIAAKDEEIAALQNQLKLLGGYRVLLELLRLLPLGHI